MKFDDDETKCPEYAPEEQKGVTEAEREWKAKTPARLPKAFFAALALVLAAAFAGGGWLYYRANVLPEKYYMRAEALFRAADYAGALALYDKIMELKPERRDLFYYMGYSSEMLGQSDDAVKFYEEHLKTEPADVNAMTRLAWICFAREDYNAALKWFREASKREMKNPVLWRKTADAAEKAGETAQAAEAWLEAAKASESAGDIMACGKNLIRLGDYRAAMEAYSLAASTAPEDKAPLHGLAAAKAMLGLPTNPRLVITPGEALGSVKLGATKAEAKAAMDGQSPDKKEFRSVGGKSMLSSRDVEIWSYGGSRAMRIIFINGEVHEIETDSALYQTEDGLGLSNFILEKNAGKLKWKHKTDEGVLVCLAKGGGLTFYAHAGGAQDERKLRVHKGDASIDGINGFPLMRFGSSG